MNDLKRKKCGCGRLLAAWASGRVCGCGCWRGVVGVWVCGCVGVWGCGGVGVWGCGGVVFFVVNFEFF